jgi:AcrR family transcriptional regulator
MDPQAVKARPKPGRRRSESSRQAILEATLGLLREMSYAAFTMDAVAARAGTGKQTIYRWWSCKGALVLDALLAEANAQIPAPETGSLAGDLEAFLRATFRALRGDKGLAPVLRALMVEAQVDPAFREVFRRALLEPRRALLAEVFSRGCGPRKLPPAELQTLVDAIYGAMWYRLLVGHAPLDDAFARALAQQMAVRI